MRYHPMIYIQRKDLGGNLETIEVLDSSTPELEIQKLIREYRQSDSSSWYYISQQPCNTWRIANQKT